MLNAKLCGFAIAYIVGCVGISPVSVMAADTNSETVILSQQDKDQKDKKNAFEDAIQSASDKWNALSEKQKTEVYNLLEKEMNAEVKLLDKLVEFGVMEKSDASIIKKRMQDTLTELKNNGQFPLSRPKRQRKQ